MSEIMSNVFNLNQTDDESINIGFINEKPEQISQEYNNLGNIFLEEAKSILHTCKGYEGIFFEEIELNSENFSKYHYQLMNNNYIIVTYDYSTKQYKYLTTSGKVFIVSDPGLIKIIHDVPIPKKITYDYVPLIDDEKILSFTLISKVLFNFDYNDIPSLLSQYLKPTSNIKDGSNYELLYHLFSIMPHIEALITKHQYWKYIYLEQDIYNIAQSVIHSHLFSSDVVTITKKKSEESLLKLLDELNIPHSELSSKHTLIEYIRNKVDLFPSLDEYIISQIDDKTSKGLIDNINAITLTKYIEEHKSFPMPSTVSNNGCIDKGIPVCNLTASKVLLRGTYIDTFFKIFSNITYSKKYFNLCSENTLIQNLLKDKVDDERLNLYSYYVSNYIMARAVGYTSDNEITHYFLTHIDTFIEDEDLNEIKKIYDTYLSDFNDIINDFNLIKCCNTKPKLLNHITLNPISVCIIEKKRLITKSLIKEIYLYCKDFNDRNKDKINIYYFDENNIYLILDKNAFNVAFDTLTRVMPTIFSKYCPNVSPTCKIEVIK